MENNIKKYLNHIVSELKKIYQTQEASQNAYWIAEFILKKSQAEIISHPEQKLTSDQIKQIENILDLHVNKHMPLQYIFGKVPFLDLEITVRPPILIPRPETEEWCSNLIEKLQILKNQKLKILDLCTGSGCIGLAIAHAFKNFDIYMIDIADEACKLAQENANQNKIKNITIYKSDLFNIVPKDLRFDIIVSNPPYISKGQWEFLDPAVKKWEDFTALVAKKSGLEIIEKIVNEAQSWLTCNIDLIQNKIPQLIIEIGYLQGAIVNNIFSVAGYQNIVVIKDFANKDRIVAGNFRCAGVTP